MVNKDGYILHKVAHKKGKRHDYDIYKRNHPVIPKQVVNVVIDLGYLDIEKDYPAEQLSSALPCKKKRNQSLSEEEKEYNKFHSKKEENSDREHTICRLRKYRILADVFRNKLRKYNKISYIVSGLINYRMINQSR